MVLSPEATVTDSGGVFGSLIGGGGGDKADRLFFSSFRASLKLFLADEEGLYDEVDFGGSGVESFGGVDTLASSPFFPNTNVSPSFSLI